jgi:uncharacterized membrane protein
MTEEEAEKEAEAKAEAKIEKEGDIGDNSPAMKNAGIIVLCAIIFIACIACLILGVQIISPWIFVLGCIVSAIALFFVLKGYSIFQTNTKDAKAN